MDPLFVWLAKTVASRSVRATLDKWQEKGLIRRCTDCANRWRSELPKDASLLSIDMFFCIKEDSSGEETPPGPMKVLASLRDGEIPGVDIWEEDLFNQWSWVAQNRDGPQAFFELPEGEARRHLRSLAELLNAECRKDPELFQLDTSSTVHVIDAKTDLIDAKLGQNTALLEQVANMLQEACIDRSGEVAATNSSGSAKGFNEDLDAACRHTKEGNPKLCIAALDKIEQHHWNDLGNHERYRLLANRASALIDAGEHKRAAKEFIACTQYEPNEEKARCWEANGYLILGDLDKCATLVREILLDFPKSTFAYALRVYSLPVDASFGDVECLVPKEFRSEDEIAMALSNRAASGKLMEAAERYARIAAEDEEPHPRVKSHLGAIIIDSTIRNTRPLLSEAPPVDEARLKEGLELLDEALAGYAQREDRTSEASCHFHKGRAYHFLGRDDESCEEFKTAHLAVPDDPNFATQYALALFENGRDEKAISLLESVADSDETLNASSPAAQLLLKRGAEGDVARGLSAIKAGMGKYPGPFHSANIELIKAAIDLYCSDGNETDGLKIARELASELPEGDKNVALASIYRKVGDSTNARRCISEALQALDEDSDAWLKHAISTELLALEDYSQAFLHMKGYVPTTCESLDTAGLIHAAQKCREDGFLLGFLEKLRSSGLFDPRYADLELGLLEKYHAGHKCISVARDMLTCKAGNDEFRSEIRVIDPRAANAAPL